MAGHKDKSIWFKYKLPRGKLLTMNDVIKKRPKPVKKAKELVTKCIQCHNPLPFDDILCGAKRCTVCSIGSAKPKGTGKRPRGLSSIVDRFSLHGYRGYHPKQD